MDVYMLTYDYDTILVLAWSSGVRRLLLESNSAVVVKLVKSPHMRSHHYAPIFKAIKG